MASRHGLNQQLSSLHVIKAGLAGPAIKEIETYDNMVTFHKDVLDEVIATISFMQAHEDVIRKAIAESKKLDAENEHV